MEPSSAPEFVEARCFLHRTGKFHEILLSMPEGFEESLNTWFDRYPTPAYRHYFIVGFSAKEKRWRGGEHHVRIVRMIRAAALLYPLQPAPQLKRSRVTRLDTIRGQYYIDKGVIPPVK